MRAIHLAGVWKLSVGVDAGDWQCQALTLDRGNWFARSATAPFATTQVRAGSVGDHNAVPEDGRFEETK